MEKKMSVCYCKSCGWTGISIDGAHCGNCGGWYVTGSTDYVPVTILNTSILTEFGEYEYSPITTKQIKSWYIQDYVIRSAVGHESTAAIISDLLGIDCPVNRIQYSQKVGDIAIVFKMNGRPPEGKILSREEIKKIGYSWGVLKRIK